MAESISSLDLTRDSISLFQTRNPDVQPDRIVMEMAIKYYTSNIAKDAAYDEMRGFRMRDQVIAAVLNALKCLREPLAEPMPKISQEIDCMRDARDALEA